MREDIVQKIELLSGLKDSAYPDQAELAGKMLSDSLRNGGKLLFAGNGGSAADAQHFAAELAGRFLMEREPLAALSLCVDPSVMTCIGNDYGYDAVFSRQVTALGRKGDVFTGISTSGNSKNIIEAVRMAKTIGMKTVCLLGKGGGELAGMCDCALVVPSDMTPRIQEIHTYTVHLLCGYLEKELFGEKENVG